MYSHLYVSHKDADRLFSAFARTPIGHNKVIADTLDAHFAQFGAAALPKLGASLEKDRVNDRFVLKFRDYLPHMPQELVDMKIEVVKAEIVRHNSAPTSARAGYYEATGIGFSATVERVFPTQTDKSKEPAPLYAQHITVCGPSLKAVQEFNTVLSTGACEKFLVNAFE